MNSRRLAAPRLVWDLSSVGEGLRRTIALRGNARQKGHGFLHWSGFFDEVQDFEGQIRALAGGTGLMSDAQFNTGTTSQPLGDPKVGKSPDLDALAAYLASLTTYDASPYYPSATPPPASYTQGQSLFRSINAPRATAATLSVAVVARRSSTSARSSPPVGIGLVGRSPVLIRQPFAGSGR